ncbi:hypothetical protein Tco_0930503 [Tanacetum coccineum]
MQKNLALIAKYFKKIYKSTNNNLRTSSNTRNKNVVTTPRYKNDNQTEQFGNQRTMTVAGARETVGSQVVQQLGYSVSTARNLAILLRNAGSQKGLKTPDTDEEIDKKELEAHYSYMAKIQEENDQNAVECDDERVALANLIANLKLDVDENKKIQKQLKKANTTLSY